MGDRMMGLMNLSVSLLRDVPFAHPVREMSEEEFELLKQSIQAEGFIGTIVVGLAGDGNFYVLDGRHRVRACRELGIETVPCFVISVTDENEMREIITVFEGVRKILSPEEIAQLLENLKKNLVEKIKKTKMKDVAESVIVERSFVEDESYGDEEGREELERRIEYLEESLRRKEEEIQRMRKAMQKEIQRIDLEEIPQEVKEKLKQEIAREYEEHIKILEEENRAFRKKIDELKDEIVRKEKQLMKEQSVRKEKEKVIEKLYNETRLVMGVPRLIMIADQIEFLCKTFEKIVMDMCLHAVVLEEASYRDIVNYWQKITENVNAINDLLKKIGEDSFLIKKEGQKWDDFVEAYNEEMQKEAEKRLKRYLEEHYKRQIERHSSP